MTRILYLNASSGVSGDMFAGALIDAGACLDSVRNHVSLLNLEGVRIDARKVSRKGLVGTKFDVLDPRTGKDVDAPTGNPCGEAHHHDDPHPHNHHHAHDREDGHGHGDAHGHGHHRGLPEILEIIRNSRLPASVKQDAAAVFELLATAEATVHGMDPKNVHFHEVGALDCIVDIVAGASAFHQLGVDEAWCSPIHVGSGTVRCAHGVLPVPAPATLELLRGMPAYSTDIQGELATPTGVALIKHFCKGFMPMPPLIVDRIGYGAGSKDFGIPNFLRATVGRRSELTLPPPVSTPDPGPSLFSRFPISRILGAFL